MPRRVLITGGGTGGHVYPGLAVAEALARLDPALEIRFAGTRRGLESVLVPRGRLTVSRRCPPRVSAVWAPLGRLVVRAEFRGGHSCCSLGLLLRLATRIWCWAPAAT